MKRKGLIRVVGILVLCASSVCLGYGPGSGGQGKGGGFDGHPGMGGGFGGHPGMGGGFGKPDPEQMMKMLGKRLDLSDAQAEQFAGLMEGHHEEMAQAGQDVGEKYKALDELVQSGADAGAIRSAAAILGTAIGEKAVLQASHMKSIGEILDAEQLEKWKEMKKMHQGGGKAGRKEGRGGPQGEMGGRSGHPWGDTDSHKGRGGPQGGRGGHGSKSDKRGERSSENIFAKMDSNGDGSITVDEFGANKGEGFNAEKMFDRLDGDGDGKITLSEFEEHMKQMKNRRGGHGGGGGRGGRGRKGGSN